jgi:hypothetical protein
MPGKKAEILILFIFVFFAVGGADAAEEQGQLGSPLTATAFYDIGCELYTAKDANLLSAKQAIVFFHAAMNLDNRADYILPDVINIAWQYPEEDLSDAAKQTISRYVDSSTDLEVVSKAAGCLLERLDSREKREELLINLIDQFGHKNVMFASDLSAKLGFLKAETADACEAQRYLMKAFAANKYNRLVFAKLAELGETGGEPLPDIVYLQNLRFAVRANPLDFTSAFSFAQYAQAMGLYEPASAGYEYCSDLANYLNGAESVSPALYRPWILCCYNAQQYSRCHKILAQLRDRGVFDLRVEAVALAAASQSGDKQGSGEILDGIKTRADKILAGKLKVSGGELEDFAWFFSFATDGDSEDILTWATKAYDADNNSVSAGSLFAYALVKNNQVELAKSVLEKVGTSAQASQLAQAQIAAEKDANSAIKMLKSAININPGTFEAQKAKAKMKELGSEYLPPIDHDAFITVLKDDFGQAFFSKFVPPEKMVTLKFNMQSSAFSYGSEIRGNLAIVNNSTEPMVICPDAMIQGNIRIDARIAGDLTEQVPAFIVKTVRLPYEIKPGDAMFIPLRLDAGRVKYLLDCHPQAELNLEYTAYVNPQVSADGRVKSELAIKPARMILKRRKLELNTRYIQQRFDALKRGKLGQKARSVQLFAGLLAEQQQFRQSGRSAYRFMYIEPELLSSALARCLSEDDWILKTQIIALMQRLKLDYRLTQAVSGELENPNWPVRLVAVYVLAKNQAESFLPVLSWTAKNDHHPMVKQLAALLSGNIEPESVEPAEPNTSDVNQPIEKGADNIASARGEPASPERGQAVEPNANDVNLP